MAKTYQQLMGEIEALKAKAEAVRNAERAGVIERIRVAIDFYGLTADDLGLGRVKRRGATGPGKDEVNGTSSRRAKPGAFADGNGNSWSGMGPRPGWLKAAIAAGKSVDDFRIWPAPASTAVLPTASSKAAKVPVKYRDDAGNSWSGRGSRPKWVTAALEAGRSLESLSVNAAV